MSAEARTEELPSDIFLLQEIVLGQSEQIDKLQRQVEWFKRHVFGTAGLVSASRTEALQEKVGTGFSDRNATNKK